MLAAYDYGCGRVERPFLVSFAMSLSFLRHGLKGLAISVYGFDRPRIHCPEEAQFCLYSDPKVILGDMGIEPSSFSSFSSILILVFIFVLLKALGYFMLHRRLCLNSRFRDFSKLGDLVKGYFSK